MSALSRSCTRMNAAPESRTTTNVHPSAVVPTPTYFRPDAKITNAITGRIYRSGTVEDSIDPIRTAGTLPMISDPTSTSACCRRGGAG
jgi:hypothetical protein